MSAAPLNQSSPGALARWRQELRTGRRGHPDRPATWLLDNLWKAACKEVRAEEFEASGDHAGARMYREWALLCLHGCHEDPRTPMGQASLRHLRPDAGRASRPAFSDVKPRAVAWRMVDGR